jgi:hypothetical protein
VPCRDDLLGESQSCTSARVAQPADATARAPQHHRR